MPFFKKNYLFLFHTNHLFFCCSHPKIHFFKLELHFLDLKNWKLILDWFKVTGNFTVMIAILEKKLLEAGRCELEIKSCY